MSKTVSAAPAATETADTPTLVPATFRAANPHDAHPWCTVTDPTADCTGPQIGLSSPEGRGLTLLTGYLSYDTEDDATSLVYGRAADDWQRVSADELRAEAGRVRAHAVRLDALADQFDAITDDSTAGALRRVAAYVAEQGITAGQAEALDIVARAVIESGDSDGAGTTLANTLTAEAGREPGAVLDLTDPAAVATHFAQLAAGVMHSARLAADPRLSDPTDRVVPTDADDWFRHLHQAELLHADDIEGLHEGRLLALIQAYAQQWGSGHGRTLKAEYAAQLADAAAFLVTEAVTASLAGLRTNPRDVAERLHRAVDNAQGWHLAEVGGHSESAAYADSRFDTAVQAMADAVKASPHRRRTAAALRTALDMVISEAGAQDGGEQR